MDCPHNGKCGAKGDKPDGFVPCSLSTHTGGDRIPLAIYIEQTKVNCDIFYTLQLDS